MLFYSALHLIEATFDAQGIHCEDHGVREYTIKKRLPKQLWIAYARLRSESEKSRYLAHGGFSMSPRAVEQELRKQKLREIRDHLQGLLGTR
jgi:hypothetical protein